MTDETTKPQPSPGYTRTLAKPIQAHGEEITVFEIREPTAADIIRVGSPVRLDLSLDQDVMRQICSELANVPPSSIGMLAAKDWQTICFDLCGRFFVPELKARTP